MAKKTQVYEYHQQHGHMVEYAGYDLPVWYEGITAETKNVREHAGIFDVSHMGRVIVEGVEAKKFLDHVTTNDVSSLASYKGQYSLLCNPKGGIIDDLTTFHLDNDRYLVVYNAANRDKNWQWLQDHKAKYHVKLRDVSDNIAMFAVQGPRAREVLRLITNDIDLEEIERYSAVDTKVDQARCLVTRTGYTGEDGFEIYVYDTTPENPARAMEVWNRILTRGRTLGLRPVGLGARDVLRLEAGMCLYGNDIDEKTTPVEAKLMFVTKLGKSDFVGKRPIMDEKEEGPKTVRVGLRILGKGIPRKGQSILSHHDAIGVITSGTLSPTLGESIGMGFVKPDYSGIDGELSVRIRDHEAPAKVVKLPFYQRRSAEKVIVYGQEMGLAEFRKQLIQPVTQA